MFRSIHSTTSQSGPNSEYLTFSGAGRLQGGDNFMKLELEAIKVGVLLEKAKLEIANNKKQRKFF